MLRKILSDHQVNSFVTSYNQTGVSLEGARGFSVIAQLTNNTPAAKTFVGGTVEVDTLTFLSKANTVARDYVVITDLNGLTWAVYADKTGSDAAPTGAIYTAIAAGRKVKADISGVTTAAAVAGAFLTAFNTLVGFTAVVTLLDNSDGTLTATHSARGVVATPVPHNLGDTTAGTIVVAKTTPGIASGTITAADTFTITAHGMQTGLKLRATTTGTLPAGITTSTDYFAIVIDANTIKLASSYANSLVPTPIDITDQGTAAATHTFTATTIAGGTAKLQGSNDNVGWADLSSPEGATTSQNITATANLQWNVANPMYDYVRVAIALTAGLVGSIIDTVVKGDVT